jgi:hypothetical protein
MKAGLSLRSEVLDLCVRGPATLQLLTSRHFNSAAVSASALGSKRYHPKAQDIGLAGWVSVTQEGEYMRSGRCAYGLRPMGRKPASFLKGQRTVTFMAIGILALVVSFFVTGFFSGGGSSTLTSVELKLPGTTVCQAQGGASVRRPNHSRRVVTS